MKSVHWPLMGGMLHSVQQGGDWAGPVPIALWFNVPAKALNNVKHFSKITANIRSWRGLQVHTHTQYLIDCTTPSENLCENHPCNFLSNPARRPTEKLRQMQTLAEVYNLPTVGAVVQLVEYRTRNQEVAGSTHPVHCKQPWASC